LSSFECYTIDWRLYVYKLTTPSIIFCTSCTSLKPSLCLLDTSNFPPSAALCSPAEPLGCRSKAEQTFSRSSLSSWFSCVSVCVWGEVGCRREVVRKKKYIYIYRAKKINK
jgi:hypothetical protein